MRKQTLSAIIFSIIAVGVIVLSFTYLEVQKEEKNLTKDLERRSLLVAESLSETVEPYLIADNRVQLQRIVDKFTDRERLMGLLVYDNKENLMASSSAVPAEFSEVKKVVIDSMDEDKSHSEFIALSKETPKLYMYALPLHKEKSVIGSLVVVHNASYIETSLKSIWENGFIRFFFYSLVVSTSIYLLIQWVLSRSVKQVIETIKHLRKSDSSEDHSDLGRHTFLNPIINEISSIHKNMLEAQLSASYEARLRLEQLDSPWTAERLKEFAKDALKNRPLYVVSNREPYIHIKKGNKIEIVEPASGMVTALNPIMKACGGVWIAHGSGDADMETVDSNDKVSVPPDDPKYDLKRVWLTKEDEKGYYYGFSNDGLWPLCHAAFVEPQFRKEDFVSYEQVNGKFAESILKEIRNVKNPLIFIQDYHFTLLPKIIKEKRPDAVIALFWHVPWPSPESFKICPWKKEILEGMLGADLLGFHTQLHSNNFIDTVRKELEALVDSEQFSVQKNNHISFVKPFPISVAFQDSDINKKPGLTKEERDEILKEFGVPPTQYIGIGVDRMDYTKGLVERFLSIERFFEKYPEFIGKFTFLQIAPNSRENVPSYIEFAKEVHSNLERINKKFKNQKWVPIVFINQRQNKKSLSKIYKSCNICMVTSLHDGMNLVSKEFIAERDDDRGVLILSQFTGASRELTESLIINPYDIDATADVIKEGLTMNEEEQEKRMFQLRKTVRNNNIYRWAAEVIKAMLKIEV